MSLISKTIKKTFINQYGAIKPTWIHQDDYYKLPFNYCDRWCERCNLAKVCRVYQKEKERNEEFIKKGIDINSSEALFSGLMEDLNETKAMIEKDMKRLGMNLTKKDLEISEDKETLKERLVEKDSLKQISFKIYHRYLELIDDLQNYFLEEIEKKEIKKIMNILFYYQGFFYAKIQRAIFSEVEERSMSDDVTFDAKTSGFLAYVALIKVINALDQLIIHIDLEKLKTQILSLSKTFIKLNQILEVRFELNENVK